MKRIIVKDISKSFKIGMRRNLGILAKIASFVSGREPKTKFWVLQDITFDAHAGKILGIIGKNGSGKSTLLRVIARIYDRDKGSIRTTGKIISLINLNIGLQPRLTMKDNIYLCCALFDLGRAVIKQRLHAIAEFAELEEFMHTKVYQFSEGMKQRLVFSIAVHCNPDILLIDEVFEVGDEKFKEQSARRIKELVSNGATVLLVSHELELIKRHCDKVIWMDKGRIVLEGPTKQVVDTYARHP